MDKSDEVVVGTIDTVVEVRIVCRVPEGQRGDAGDAKSVRGVLWQPNSAETAEGELVSMACAVSFQLTGTVREPREDKARCFDSGREVEVAKCGFSEDCEGWIVAASRDDGVEICWQGVPRVHQSGKDVRRRGPADVA